MSDQTQVDELLLRYEELQATKTPAIPEELCRDCPHLLADFKQRLEALEAVNAWLNRNDAGAETDAAMPTELAAGPLATAARYRIVRPHARGGLGEVLVAEDEDLHRPVALKRLHPLHAHSPHTRQRFLREAEVTSRLEHPGIVPVHTVGQDADGRPFYAMRFVQGETLQEASQRLAAASPAERRPALRQLLGRFTAVCNCVAYVHSRGVVHRDLKPGNIVLGAYGETLVVDWGLAKPGDDVTGAAPPAAVASAGIAATQDGTVIGTPAYMSPEQAAGRHEQVGPASDIYSLGATLYTLLTGQAPFQGREVADVLDQVQRGAVHLPRAHRADIPRPLEAICLKAMALQPEERYATALELAADVERWLADDPVSAWREPLTARVRRWLGRHRTLVTAAAVGVVTVMVLMAVATVLLTASNRRERESRDRAEHNLREARRAVHEHFTLFSQAELGREHGTQELRRKLLRSALEYYQGLLQQHPQDAELRDEVAAAHFRLGALENQIGSCEEALADFHAAGRIWQELRDENPGDFRVRLNLAACCNRVGWLQKDIGHFPEALQAFGRARTLLEDPLPAHLTETAWQELAVNAHNLALIHHARQEWEQARRCHEQARDLWARLWDAHPTVPEYGINLAMNARAIAQVLRNTGAGKTQVLDGYHKAGEILKRLYKAQPQLAAIQLNLGYHYGELGELHLRDGAWNQALEHYEQARKFVAPIAEANPAVQEHRSHLADYLGNIAVSHLRLGHPEEALQTLQQARHMWEPLTAGNPSVRSYRQGLAGVWYHLGSLHHDRREWVKAWNAYQHARALQEQLVRRNPDDHAVKVELAKSTTSLATLYRDTGRAVEALRLTLAARALWEHLARTDPAATFVVEALASSCHNAGLLRNGTGHPAEAQALLLEAWHIWTELHCTHPTAASFVVELGRSCNALGDVARGAARFEEALAWYTRALATLDAVPAAAPADPRVPQLRSTFHQARARTWTQLGRYAEALPDWRRAIDLDAGPDRDYLRLEWAGTLAHLGDHARAAREVRTVLDTAAPSGERLYQGAQVLAAVAAHEETPPTAVGPYAGEAVARLVEAERRGFFKSPAQRERLTNDPAFDELRTRSDFWKLVRGLHAEARADDGGK